MPIRLCRIDDRLIHGQVVLGWARALGISRIVLVDDAVAASPWEQDLYRMGVPPELQLSFLDVAQARSQLSDWQQGQDAILLLTGDVDSMARLLAGIHDPPAVNVGGVHHRPGRTERLPYVFLTEGEWQELRTLEAAGVEVTAQDVPGAGPVRLGSLA